MALLIAPVLHPHRAPAFELSFGCPALLEAENGIDSVLSSLLYNFNL